MLNVEVNIEMRIELYKSVFFPNHMASNETHSPLMQVTAQEVILCRAV